MTSGVGSGGDSTLKINQHHKAENHTTQSLQQGESEIYNAETKTEMKTSHLSINEFTDIKLKGTHISNVETKANNMTKSNGISPAGKRIQKFLDSYDKKILKDDVNFESLVRFKG